MRSIWSLSNNKRLRTSYFAEANYWHNGTKHRAASLQNIAFHTKAFKLHTLSAVSAFLIMSEYLGWSECFAFADPPARFFVTFAVADADTGAVTADILYLWLSKCSNKDRETQNFSRMSHTNKRYECIAKVKPALIKRNARTWLRRCGRGHLTSVNGVDSLSLLVFLLMSFVVPYASFPQQSRSEITEQRKGRFSLLYACAAIVDKPQFFFLQLSERTTTNPFDTLSVHLRYMFCKFLQFC